MDAKELLKKAERHEANAHRKYNDYQNTGYPRAYTEYKRYDELAKVYRMAYENQNDEDNDRTRRLKNYAQFIQDHVADSGKSTYTAAEVASLCKQLEQFCI